MSYDIGSHLAEPGPGGTWLLTPKTPDVPAGKQGVSDLFTLRPGDRMTISWAGELRTVTCDRIENGGAVIRDLTEEEQDDLDEQAYDEFLQRKAEAP